jgi:hypothetical protein
VSRVSFGLIFVCACLLSRLYPLLLAPAVWTLVDGNGRSAFDCFLRVWVCSASTLSPSLPLRPRRPSFAARSPLSCVQHLTVGGS